MSDRNDSSTGGIGFAGLLTIVFITLKLMGHITWPWLWVLSPIWLPVVIILAIFILGFIVSWMLDNKQ